MKNTTHRVVILKNVNSNLISQAILILKDSADDSNTGIMLEAERIVEKYMSGQKTFSPPEKKPAMCIGVLSATAALFGIGLLMLIRFI